MIENKSFKTLPGVDIVDKNFLDKVLNMLLNREDDEELHSVLDKIQEISFWDISLQDTNDELAKYRQLLKTITKLRSEAKPINIIKESISSTRVFKEIIDENSKLLMTENYNDILDLLKTKIKTMLLYKFFSVYNEEFLIRAYSGSLLEEKDFKKVINEVERLYSDITFDAISEDTIYSNPNDIEKRFNKLLDKIKNPQQNKIISSGIDLLDVCFRNLFGFESGHVYIFGGPYGLGKTRLMIYIGSCAFLAGHNVLHITIENKKEDVELMYDTRFMQITPEEIYMNIYKIVQNEEQAKEKMNQIIKNFKLMMSNFNNELQIKKYRPYKVNVNHIESFIKRKLARGEKKPDLVIIDHMDIMSSNQGYIDNLFHKGELITSEIKDLAERYNLVLITPTQMGREGVKKNKSYENKKEKQGIKVVGGEGISRSMAKNELADLVCTMNQDEKEAHLGILRLFIDKNRNGIDKVIIPLKFNKSLISIENIDENTFNSLSEIVRNHTIKLFKRLKKRKELEKLGTCSEQEQNLFQDKKDEINKETAIEMEEISTEELFNKFKGEEYIIKYEADMIYIIFPNITYKIDIDEFRNYMNFIEVEMEDKYYEITKTNLYKDISKIVNELNNEI